MEALQTEDLVGGIVILLLGVALLVWLFVGLAVNRQRATALSHWVDAELRPYGEPRPLRWLGPGSFEVTVPEAHTPFRLLVCVVHLEARQAVVLWLLNRFLRRGDLVLLRADLARAPAEAAEVFRPASLIARDADRWAKQEGWAPVKGPDGLVRAAGSETAAALRDRLVAALDDQADRLEWLAVRPEAPHLVLGLSLAGVAPEAAPPIGRTLARLGELAGP
jgi:hypothetical protein